MGISEGEYCTLGRPLRWLVLFRSKNRDGVVDIYMSIPVLYPPFSVYLATKTSLALSCLSLVLVLVLLLALVLY